MARYKLTIEYNGSNLSGWQRQKGVLSVQEIVEGAIRCFTGKDVRVFCAGRTDAGVHAVGQVAHFDIDELKISNDSIIGAMNFYLKRWLVAVIALERVDNDWHARFSATSKTYVYKMVNRRARLALDAGRALHVPSVLDIESMRASSSMFLGIHDFTSFRSSECQAQNPVRSVDYCGIEAIGANIDITFKARSFLHNQVRIMSGCLLAVGLGKKCDIAGIIAARDRRAAYDTLPAYGLYLVCVEYGDKTHSYQ